MNAQIKLAETYQIAEYSPTAAALSALRGKYQGVVFPVETPAGLKQAREARTEIKGYRVDLEKLRKEIKAPALERCRLIDEEAKRISAELEALETPIDAQIKAEETRKEAERQAKEAAERARVAIIHDLIGRIKNAPAAYVGKPSAEIRAALQQAGAFEINADQFMEFAELARVAKAEAVAALDKLAADTEAREAELQRIAEERAELARLRAAEEARLRAEREAHEAKMCAEREEAARIEAEQRRAREAEERRLAEARAELERQRRDAEAAQARAQAERLQAEREAAARARREAAERKAAERLRTTLDQIEQRWSRGEISAAQALREAYARGRADLDADEDHEDDETEERGFGSSVTQAMKEHFDINPSCDD